LLSLLLLLTALALTTSTPLLATLALSTLTLVECKFVKGIRCVSLVNCITTPLLRQLCLIVCGLQHGPAVDHLTLQAFTLYRLPLLLLLLWLLLSIAVVVATTPSATSVVPSLIKQSTDVLRGISATLIVIGIGVASCISLVVPSSVCIWLKVNGEVANSVE
jgi:hypothetical protein